MKAISIGVVGLGTVGVGVANVLQRNRNLIEARTGCHCEITHAAVQDVHKPRACHTDTMQLSNNVDELIEQVDIVVELMGGTETANKVITQALRAGKHVVTANKALIAQAGTTLLQLADEHRVLLGFEAAVAGGIPIIKIVRQSMVANQVSEIDGIINGTSNYILSEMTHRQLEFSQALKQAQALGYAEADPSFDIEGTDAQQKIAILATLAYGIPLDIDSIYVEGIQHITAHDIRYAQELGYRIKHLAIAKLNSKGLELRVHPALVSSDSILAHIEGPMNAVRLVGDAVGETLYYGAGAGAEPTASAVVADICDIAAFIRSGNDRAGINNSITTRVLPRIDDFDTANYLRMDLLDQPGVLAELTKILGEHSISIKSMLQKQEEKQEQTVPIIIVTQNVLEQRMQQAIKEMQALHEVQSTIIRIRIKQIMT